MQTYKYKITAEIIREGGPSCDRSWRNLNELDRNAVITVTGEGLDEIGRHVQIKRGWV